MRDDRSWLFVPGDNERRIRRALDSGADAVILDLEDSVTAGRRTDARACVADVLSGAPPDHSELWVRINPLSEPDALVDLVAAVRGALTGVLLPKVRQGADVARLDDHLSALEVASGLARGSVRIAVVATETPEMMFRLGELGGVSARLHSVTWGAEDLSAAVGATGNRSDDGDWDAPYQLARSLCLLAARAAGAQPVDTLHADFADDAGLEAATRLARRQGFTGKIAIHPRQVPIINRAFTPSADEVDDARGVVAAFAENPEAGAVSIGGRMLDRPHLVQAEKVIQRYESLGAERETAEA